MQNATLTLDCFDNIVTTYLVKSFYKFSLTVTHLGIARTYLQLPLRQWGAGNVYLLVLSSWKVNIAENPIAVMGL